MLFEKLRNKAIRWAITNKLKVFILSVVVLPIMGVLPMASELLVNGLRDIQWF